MSEQKIYEVLPELMKRIGAITKNRKNQHQGYQFRGIDDVLNAVGPACADLGVCVSPTVHDHRSETTTFSDKYGNEKFRILSTLKLRLEFVASDGSKHVAEAIGEAMDTQGDKATNKAMSIAFKYACFMGLVIPVEGALDDSDNDDKQPEGKKPAPKPPVDRNAGCKNWRDWKGVSGNTLGDLMESDKTKDEKLKILNDLKATYEKAVNNSKTNEEQARLERDFNYINDAIDNV